MKQLHFLWMVFMFIQIIHTLPAQKMKDKRVEISYVSLPAEKLPAAYTTYSVQLTGGNITMGGLTAQSLAQQVRMDGFKRVGALPNEYGHLRIHVFTGTTVTGRSSLKSKTTTTKNDKGVETKTTTYWYELPCSANTWYKILDPEGNTLSTGSNSHSENVRSREYSSSGALAKDYDAIVRGIRKNFSSTAAKSAVSTAQKNLTATYDFAHAKADGLLYTLKKHPEEDLFDQHLETAMAVFKALPATASADEGLSQLSAPVAFWKKYADAHPGKDKNLTEVYIAVNSNLAHVYTYLDRLEEADMHARRILAVDPKEKRTERLLDFMTKIKGRMDFHGIHTIRHARDLSQVVPPSLVKAIEEEKDQLQTDNNSISGYVIMGGDTLEGFFARSKTDDDFIFGANGNTKFMRETVDALEEVDLTSAQVTSFWIGERPFMKIKFSPCSKGKEEAGLHILEEVFVTDKIALFKYYPATGVLSNTAKELAFRKAGEEMPISLLDSQFLLWEKGLSAYFRDCADLAAACSGGGYKMTEGDLIKVARVYSELCP